MTKAGVRVLVVDDDPSVRKSLGRLLKAAGYDVETFASAREFLRRERFAGPSCLVLDVFVPDLDGFDLQQTLAAEDDSPPIVFISGRGDIPMSVRAMKAGAVDFLTKPFRAEALLACIEEALARSRRSGLEHAEMTSIRQRLAALTPREHEVLRHVVAGQPNKQIAGDLGISERTVKIHRGRVMRKTAAGSVAELVRLAEKAGVGTPPNPRAS